MDQATYHTGRRTGWSDREAKMLWETADEAQQQGLPLKAVFEQIAQQTGRRPNSIRNYYYAQVREQSGGQERTARFVPFTEEEVLELMETVLRDKAAGKSVRSCLQRISGGDHSLMLRYQNKYRAVIKGRPDIVERVVAKLAGEGLQIKAPEVSSRSKLTLQEACSNLSRGAQSTGDDELVRAVETLGHFIERRAQQGNRGGNTVRMDLYRMALDSKQQAYQDLLKAADLLIQPIKDYLGQPLHLRENELEPFCARLSERIDALEQCMQEAGVSGAMAAES